MFLVLKGLMEIEFILTPECLTRWHHVKEKTNVSSIFILSLPSLSLLTAAPTLNTLIFNFFNSVLHTTHNRLILCFIMLIEKIVIFSSTETERGPQKVM